MNIVVFDIGALRVEHLGCYGYSRPTSPAMDALAARGVRYTAAAHPALVRADTLGQFGQTRRAQAQAYAAFVEEGLLRKIGDPAALVKGQLVLGRDKFTDKILRLNTLRQKATGNV